MRFMSVYRPGTSVERMDPPSTAEIETMGKLIEEETKRGILVSTGGLLPSAMGARVRRSGSDLAVTDGPFTEAKELIAGFGIVQVKSKDEAVEAAKRFLRVAGEGISEVRPFYGAGFAAPEGTMLYMLLWRPSQSEKDATPPTPEHLAAMNALTESESQSGVLLATGGLGPSALGARVRSVRGDIAVIDGPFAEAKELVAGFGVFEVPSKAEAIEAAKRFLHVVGEGECEIRPMFEAK